MNDDFMKKFEDTRPDGVKPSTRMTCMAGQVICKQGTPANQAFFIEDGLVEVVMDVDGEAMVLGEIGSGDVFGEMGVLEQELRFATVRAKEKSCITVMTNDELVKRVEQVDDPVVVALVKGLSKRLRTASEGQINYFKSLANLQNRVAGLMGKTGAGIDRARREEFAAEIAPVLAQVEAILDKYKSSSQEKADSR